MADINWADELGFDADIDPEDWLWLVMLSSDCISDSNFSNGSVDSLEDVEDEDVDVAVQVVVVEDELSTLLAPPPPPPAALAALEPDDPLALADDAEDEDDTPPPRADWIRLCNSLSISVPVLDEDVEDEDALADVEAALADVEESLPCWSIRVDCVVDAICWNAEA
jgi:hypothetical protein